MFRTVTFLWFGLSMALAHEPPVFTAGSISNAANLVPGITAGAIVTITGLRLTNSTSPRLISRFDHRLNPAVAEAAQPHGRSNDLRQFFPRASPDQRRSSSMQPSAPEIPAGATNVSFANCY